MNDTQDISPAERDGRYEFKMSYSEREVICRVEKEQNVLHVSIDNGINATLKINADGSVTQTEGNNIPDSIIEFIKKRVLGK